MNSTAKGKMDEHQNAEEQAVWEMLEQVKDPEIPVVSVVEMGIIREIAVNGKSLIISMTPTFSGCPALYAMQTEINSVLKRAGYTKVEIRISHDPPWTSDWITPAARQKLKSFGLAPPPIHAGNFAVLLSDTAQCPYCDSINTTLKNTFGSALCRAIYVCNDCHQPFEKFKPL